MKPRKVRCAGPSCVGLAGFNEAEAMKPRKARPRGHVATGRPRFNEAEAMKPRKGIRSRGLRHLMQVLQ